MNPTEPQSAEMQTEKICLNCGTIVNDRYCRRCGQPTNTPDRLRMKNLASSVLVGLSRMTPGFINTTRDLIIRPWDVIRDYIRGRRMKYTAPITMLLILGIYTTVFFSVFDSFFGTSLLDLSGNEEGNFGYIESGGTNPFLLFIDRSYIFSVILAGIPLTLIFYIAFYRHGAKKYNFAEYISAFIYITAAGLIYDFILTFAYLIPGFDRDMFELIQAVVFITILIILTFKAFPQDKHWKNWGLLLWFLALTFGAILLLRVIIRFLLF